MNTLTSHDGTAIAYDKTGQGPAVILVDGALTCRSSGSKPQLAELLAQHFTVYCYDRRGRGDSGDTQPYAVEREIEDIEALIDDAGEPANLYGHSSGACLAMDASLALGAKVASLAMYEAPYNDDPDAQPRWHEYLSKLTTALAANRRGDAAAAFMRLAGTPTEQIDGMRRSPFWAATEAIAPTLAYDHAGVIGERVAVPADRAARVAVPALVMHGEAGAPFMGVTAATLGRAMPHAQLVTLPGQTHDVKPDVLAPRLIDFFSR